MNAVTTTGRDRPRDPRLWAMPLVGGMPFAVGIISKGGSLTELLLATLLAAATVGAIGWFVMPEWTDSRHSPWTGAACLFLGGVLAALAVLLIF